MYAQTKVQFIDLSWISCQCMKEFSCHKIELETLTGTNPQPIESIKTLTQEDSIKGFLQEIGGSTLGFQHNKEDDLHNTQQRLKAAVIARSQTKGCSPNLIPHCSVKDNTLCTQDNKEGHTLGTSHNRAE